MRVTVWFKSLEEMEAFTDITVKQEGDTPTAFNPVSVIFKGRDA